MPINTANLVAYWKCDESSGTSLGDSKSTHTGTLTGTSVPTFSTGLINNALYCAGGTGGATTSYVTAPTSSDWTFGTGDFSINFWVYQNNTSGFIGLIDMGAGAFSGVCIEYKIANGGWNIYLNGQNLGQFVSSLSVNTWYMISLTRIGTTVTMYINGTSVHTFTGNSTNIANSGATISLARFIGASENLNGRMDEIAIWKGYGLTSGDITSLYNSGAGSAIPVSNSTMFFKLLR